jgi:hypothetical protein
MIYRVAIFTIRSPIPNTIRDVTLHENTWSDKILLNHPEMAPHIDAIEKTIEAPTFIYESETTQGNFVFVNTLVRDTTDRPLRVAVKPIGADGEVRSAYFSSNVTPGAMIWPSQPK